MSESADCEPEGLAGAAKTVAERDLVREAVGRNREAGYLTWGSRGHGGKSEEQGEQCNIRVSLYCVATRIQIIMAPRSF